MEPTMGTGMYKMADEPAGKVKGIVDGMHKDEAEMAGKLKACLSESFPAHFGEKDEGAEKMAAEDLNPAANAKLDVDPSNLPQNAAVHIKTGNIHDEGGRKNAAVSDEEKRAMSAFFNDRGLLFREVQRLTRKNNPNEMVAALTAMKHASEEVVTLTANARRQSGREFDDVVTKGQKAMKITPADAAPNSKTKTGQYIASLRAKGDEGIAALSAYIDAMPARVTTADAPNAPQEPANGNLTNEGDVVTLTSFDVDNIKRYGGNDPKYREKYLNAKKAKHAEYREAGINPIR